MPGQMVLINVGIFVAALLKCLFRLKPYDLIKKRVRKYGKGIVGYFNFCGEETYNNWIVTQKQTAIKDAKIKQ